MDPSLIARHPLLRAFRFRNFRLYFIAQIIGLNGNWLTFAALGWLIFRLSGDPFMLGLLTFCMHAPAFFFTPIAGVVADKVSRKKVIAVTQLTDAFVLTVLAWLTLTDQVEVIHVLIACVLLGTAKGFAMPSRQAMIAEIVEDRSLMGNAIALNSTVFHSARLIGPMLAGGILIPLGGEGLCFALNSGAYLVSAACIIRLQLNPRVKDPHRPTFLAELSEGFRYAFRTPSLRDIILLVVAFSLFGQAFSSLLPIFAGEILDGDSGTFGLLVSSLGLGALVAGALLASRESIAGLDRFISRCLFVMGIALAGFSLSQQLWISLLLLMVVGFTSVATMIGSNTLLQTRVENDFRGRVMSIFSMAFMGGIPLGALVIGKVASLVGAPPAVLGTALLSLLVAIAFHHRLGAPQGKTHSD